MPTELTIAEFAEQVAPCQFRAWRAMRNIVIGSATISPSRAARVERAAAVLIAKHRDVYIERYPIDEQTFLPQIIVGTSGRPGMLAHLPDPTEHERMITEFATRHAYAEAMQLLIDRYRRQYAALAGPSRPTIAPIYRSRRDPPTLAERIAAKLLAAMVRPDVTITATHDGIFRRALGRVELQAAAIDLAQGVLTIAGRAWSMVQIEIADTVGPLRKARARIDDTKLLDKVRARPVGQSVRAAVLEHAGSSVSTAEQQDATYRRILSKL